MRERTGRVINGMRVQRGPGDLVASAASSVGLGKCAGCERRRKWLNAQWKRFSRAAARLGRRLRRRAG